jgi:hypothetical protein
MKWKPILVVVLVTAAPGLLQERRLRAQVMSPPPNPNPSIPLEAANPNTVPPPTAMGAPGTQPSVYPSNQSSAPSWAAIAGLRNPYQWASPVEKGRLFGHYWAKKRAEQAIMGATAPPAAPYAPMVAPAPGVPGAPMAAPAPGAPGAAPGAAPQPGMEQPAPGAETPPGTAAPTTAAEAAAAAEGAAGPGFGGAAGGTGGLGFNMVGDEGGYRLHSLANSGGTVGPIPPPGPRQTSAPFPSVRNFKISENQSPRPQDRIFFDFNYYNNLNATIDRHDQVPLRDIKAYRYLWGFEKTFNDGKGSIGMRLPLNTLTADSVNGAISTPTTSALGNLTIFGKYILEQNRQTGSLISVGLALTPNTGPSQFANSKYVFGLNTMYFQPFLGYIWNIDRFYLQGFLALDAPVSTQDVTMLYNDIGFGYYVYKAQSPDAFLSAVAPTFEIHVNNPLNHRDPFNRFDIAGTQDVVNLTYGINFLLMRQAVMTFAFITPVSSPKPYDTELALLFNWYFGRTRANPVAMQPPVVQ